MSHDVFYLAVKSTLDAVMNEIKTSFLATYPSLLACDLDDTAETDNVLAGSAPALVWRINSLQEDPIDPLYHWKFLVGVKTTKDSGNYNLSDLMARLAAAMSAKRDTIIIMDYSGDLVDGLPTEKLGSVRITSVDTTPQQFDHQSGVRLLSINAKVIRCVH